MTSGPLDDGRSVVANKVVSPEEGQEEGAKNGGVVAIDVATAGQEMRVHLNAPRSRERNGMVMSLSMDMRGLVQ